MSNKIPDEAMATLLGEYLELDGPAPTALLVSLKDWARHQKTLVRFQAQAQEAELALAKAKEQLASARENAKHAEEELITTIQEHRQ